MTVKSASTMSLDIATLGTAFELLTSTIGMGSWHTQGDEVTRERQARLLAWLSAHREQIAALKDVATEVSQSADTLNTFLKVNGFPEMFDEIDGDGIGVAAIIDMMVEWAVKAHIVMMPASVPVDGRLEPRSVRAFQLPSDGFTVYAPEEYSDVLVRLHAKDGSSAWMIMIDQPRDEMALNEVASDLLSKCTASPEGAEMVSSVIVPTLEFEVTLGLDWLLGMGCGDHQIAQAFQILRLTMDEVGGRVQAATGLATTRGAGLQPRPIIFNRPFLLFFTQPGSDVPVGASYITSDRWTLS